MYEKGTSIVGIEKMVTAVPIPRMNDIRINLNMKSLLLIASGFWLLTHIHIVLYGLVVGSQYWLI